MALSIRNSYGNCSINLGFDKLTRPSNWKTVFWGDQVTTNIQRVKRTNVIGELLFRIQWQRYVCMSSQTLIQELRFY